MSRQRRPAAETRAELVAIARQHFTERGPAGVKLDEFLILDFRAEMKIKSLVYFFQAKNMNHDQYYFEPGSHPPGVHFRYGIQWILMG